MKLLSTVLGGLALAATTVLGKSTPQMWNYLNELTSDPIQADFVLTKKDLGKTLEVPRVHPRPNSTSFDWWYFDAVNPANINESAVVVFYLTTNDSFPLRMTTNNSVSVDVFLTHADGSAPPVLIDSAPSLTPTDYAATVTYDGEDTICGNWTNMGLNFEGNKKGFTVNVNNPAYGITGSLKIKTSGPGYYPCSVKGKEGESLEGLSHVGWTNSVPGGDADVDFMVHGKSLKFSNGLGYHDRKWGDQPFQRSVKDWYWGHASMGNYNVVWLYAKSHDGKTYSNAFLSHPFGDYRVACEDDCVKSLQNIMDFKVFGDRYEITFNFKDHGNPFTMVVDKIKVLAARGPFIRFTGKTKATINDGGISEGIALFQEFHF